MINVIKQILKRAKNGNGVILLPEANVDERVKSACELILKYRFGKIAVIGKSKEFPRLFKTKYCKIFDLEDQELLEQMAKKLLAIRRRKGMTIGKARELVKLPQYFSMMLLKLGMVDGVVAGAQWTTADVLRPALQIIKTKADKSICVGTMLMVKDGAEPLLFSDVSLNLNPDSKQLAEIAVASAEFMNDVVNVEPKVAMLSYSTNGSAKGEMVDKIKEATAFAKEKSMFAIEGEMQADVALDLETAVNKKFENAVAGKANVLIFPDINAGNIGYKLASRLGGYQAIGPIILNFNKPVNDLSRGCTVDEIVYTACITRLLIDQK